MNLELKKELNTLLDYRVLRWEELPEFELYRDQVIKIVTEIVYPLYRKEETVLTANMINNYVKWDCMPKSNNKKYSKKHLAYLIILSFLKPVLNLQQIKKGIDLQLKILPTHEAYNNFCDILEDTINDIFTPFLEGEETYQYHGFQTTSKLIALRYAASALCFKRLTELILDYNGIYGGKI